MQKVFLGVDVGGTKTAVLLSTRPPESLGRIEFATLPEQGPERALTLIVESARHLLDQHGFGEDSIAAIGVSCGSPLDRVRGIIQAPPNLATWVDVPIRRLLEEAFHTTCRVENDANAGAVAEIALVRAWVSTTCCFLPWAPAWAQASLPPAVCTWGQMVMQGR